MEEQSHKDEMRAALRGDFERMRRRLTQGEVEPVGSSPTELAEEREPQGGAAEAPPGSWLDRLLGRA